MYTPTPKLYCGVMSMLQPPAGVEIEYLEQCKFTSAAFKKQVMISIEPQNVSVGIVPDLEPSFNWINPKADSANGIITPGGAVKPNGSEIYQV